MTRTTSGGPVPSAGPPPVFVTEEPVGSHGLPALPEVVVAVGDVESCTFLNEEDVSTLAVAVAPGSPGADDDADDGDELQARSGTLDAALRYGVDLAEHATRARFRAAAGTTHVVDLPRVHGRRGAHLPWEGLPLRVVLVGLGDGSPESLRLAGAALAAVTRGDSRVVSAVSADADAAALRAFVEGYLLGNYRPQTTASGAAAPRAAEQLVLLTHAQDEARSVRALQVTQRTAAATWLARDLTNCPAHQATPEWFVEEASALADDAGLELAVWDSEQLRTQGFGGLLAVGGGAEHEPRLLVISSGPPLTATQGEARPTHIVIVGAGLTYDTGGLQITPRTALPAAKRAMAGVAAALTAVWAAAHDAQATRNTRITAVLALAENAFDARAVRPDDVITLHGGTTVEVGRTSAGAQIVLAEALAYAATELEPTVLIDLSTLNRVSSQTLGRTHAPFFATDSTLSAALVAAGDASGEAVWQLPLVEDYRSATRSTLADLRAVPAPDEPMSGADAVVSALFLERFVGEVRWAHLDISGPSVAPRAAGPLAAGATGFGVRLLTELMRKL